MYVLPPWVPTFEQCLKQAQRPHTFSLATVSSTGFPHARTCVSRGWLFDDKSTGVLLFTTDARSQKVQDLGSTGGVFEACFYFPGKSHDNNTTDTSNTNSNTSNSDNDRRRSSSSDSNTSSNSQASNSKPRSRRPPAGVQIRLSGFAQCLSPSLGLYPTMAPPGPPQATKRDNAPTPPLVPRPTDEDSISCDDQAYLIYSPTYVKEFRDHFKQLHHSDSGSNTESHSGLVEGTGNIIPKKSEASTSKTKSELAQHPHEPQHHTHSHHHHHHHNNSNSHSTPLDYPPPVPTSKEWDEEYQRVWELMSPPAKSSFRRPTPGSTMDDTHRRQLDKLARGVDGASDEKGLSNFVVVVMFVNDADVLVDAAGSTNRRHKAHRVMEDDWIEEEVCP